MKLFLFIALIVVFSASVLCDHDIAELRKFIEECHKQHNISPSEFKDVIQGKLVPSENFKCSVHCTMIKQGVIDAAGVFNADVAKSRHPNDAKFPAAVDNCKAVSGTTPCDTAYKISACLKEQM